MLHGLSYCRHMVPSHGPSAALPLEKQITSMKLNPMLKVNPLSLYKDVLIRPVKHP